MPRVFLSVLSYLCLALTKELFNTIQKAIVYPIIQIKLRFIQNKKA